MVVAVLQGSTRRDRMGDRASRWVIAQLQKRGHEAVLVDAATLKLPLLDRMWKELKAEQNLTDGDESLRKTLSPVAELFERVDGFAIVSAEYNHAAPPALVNLLDYFLEEYFYRPSAIICYSASAFGGVRAAIQLRSLLAELGMPSIPTLQPIPMVNTALSSEGIQLTQAMAEHTEKFFEEFDWYMMALQAGRERHDPRVNS